MREVSVTAQLKCHPKTNTILMGYVIGTAELPHDRTLTVIACGDTVRFSIDGLDGYVDLELSEIAGQAAILLTEQTFE